MFRYIAFLLLALAVFLVFQDALVFLDRGVFPARSIGEIWASVHRDSLLLLEPGIVRHVFPPVGQYLWDWVVFPVLQRSAALVAFILALLIFVLRWRARRRQARRAAGFSMKRPGPR